VEPKELEGPSDRAVSLARGWLSAAGWVWLLAAIGVAIASTGDSYWVSAAVFALAIAHFFAARYGSRRVAVFFAIFGP